MLRLSLALAAGVVLLVGCDSGPKLIDVEGTVTVAGQPMDKIYVEFWPEGNGPRSTGMTDAQGKFTLTSDDGKSKGAIAGTHKVVLRDTSIINDKVIGRAAEDIDITEGRKPRILKSYDDVSKSPLKADVSADKKTIELQAEPYSGP